MVKIFVSSDTESITAGNNFLISLADALKNTSLLLILCSEASIRRPWIHFELGAVWNSGKPIIPICHSGFLPRNLPMPLSIMQAVETNNRGLEQIYKRVAEFLNCDIPATGRDELLDKVKAFEKIYIENLLPDPAPKRRDLAWKRIRKLS
jgi:hypothetical protein